MKISVSKDIKIKSFEKDMKYLQAEIDEIEERQKDFYSTGDACCPHLDSIAYDLNTDSIDYSVEYGRNYSRWHAGYIVIPEHMYRDECGEFHLCWLSRDEIRSWLRNEVRSIGVNYFRGDYDSWARFVD